MLISLAVWIILFYFDNQNKSNMYILINKVTQESAVIKEKSTLSTLINRSVATIYRKQSLKCWETNEFLIYNPQKVIIKSLRGGKNNFKTNNVEYWQSKQIKFPQKEIKNSKKYVPSKKKTPQ